VNEPRFLSHRSVSEKDLPRAVERFTVPGPVTTPTRRYTIANWRTVNARIVPDSAGLADLPARCRRQTKALVSNH